jgi:hypothetical protein
MAVRGGNDGVVDFNGHNVRGHKRSSWLNDNESPINTDHTNYKAQGSNFQLRRSDSFIRVYLWPFVGTLRRFG